MREHGRKGPPSQLILMQITSKTRGRQMRPQGAELNSLNKITEGAKERLFQKHSELDETLPIDSEDE